MNTSQNNIMSIHAITWYALLAALIAFGAYCEIRLGPVPYTLQDIFVALSGLLLGPVGGALTVLLYLAAGAIGLPVFSGGSGGVGHIFGATGGYLIGFIFMALIAGAGSRISERFRKKGQFIQHVVTLVLFMGAALFAQYAVGVTWLAYIAEMPLYEAIAVGALPFVVVDSAQMAVTIILWRMVARFTPVAITKMA